MKLSHNFNLVQQSHISPFHNTFIHSPAVGEEVMKWLSSLTSKTRIDSSTIRELTPPKHICFLVDQVVESMDLREIKMRYDGPGAPAYPVELMLKLWITAVIDGVRSSRRLDELTHVNVIYMYLARPTLISGHSAGSGGRTRS